MTIRDVELLLALARHPNLSRVAVEQETTQPRLSERLRRIEVEVGARLFDRTSRGIKLTQAGRKFLPFARTISDTFAQGVLETAESEDELRGELHVGISHTHAAVIPELMVRFQDQYRGIKVKVTRTQADHVASSVSSKRFDVGLCYEPLSYDGLVWEPLFKAHMIVVAASDTRLPSQTTLASLSDSSFVLPTRACSTRVHLDRCVVELGLVLKIKMEIDDPQALLAIVKTGFAISILPETKVPVSRRLKTSRLVRPEIQVEGGILLRTEVSKVTKLFATFLRLNLHSILAQSVPNSTPTTLAKSGTSSGAGEAAGPRPS